MSDEVKKGLLGIVVDETTISHVVPELSALTYRGYTVQELCDKCDFEEVAKHDSKVLGDHKKTNKHAIEYKSLDIRILQIILLSQVCENGLFPVQIQKKAGTSPAFRSSRVVSVFSIRTSATSPGSGWPL